ncbi:MAG: WecB/TagA/CpsF family glycosyltransferase, partial [Patescibacteria group bacterium]
HHVAGDAAKTPKEKYPRLNLVGATSALGPSEKDDERTLSYIHECMYSANITNIDIVFVAYGHPKQEFWIKRVSNLIPAKVSIGVGGTFDYFSGIQRHAPAPLVMLNLEWLFRLATQPWRFRRIVSAFLYFPLLVYKSILKKPEDC